MGYWPLLHCGMGQSRSRSKLKVQIQFCQPPSREKKKRGVKATFFVLGRNVKKYPKLVKRISEEGHLIGNHTYDHIELNKVPEEKARKEIKKANKAVRKVTGKNPEYMRPPYGECSRKLEDSLDMILVRWTIDPLDWKTENTDEIVNKVVTEAGENDIILFSCPPYS